MRIESVTASNFKGHTFKSPLAQVTVFVGDNSIGKSSRAEAITLALAGYVPGVERKPAMILDRLGSTSSMSVQANFDNGTSVSRRYVREAGKNTTSCKVGTRGLPLSWAVHPSLLDADEFLELSDKARVSFLFHRLDVDIGPLTPERLFEPVYQSAIGKSEAATEMIYAMEQEALGDYNSSVDAGLPPQSWLESALTKYRDQHREAVHDQNIAAKDLCRQPRPARKAWSCRLVESRAAEAVKKYDQARFNMENARGSWRTAIHQHDAVLEERASAAAEQFLKTVTNTLIAAQHDLDQVNMLHQCPRCHAKHENWRENLEKQSQDCVANCQQEVKAALNNARNAHDALLLKKRQIAETDTRLRTQLDELLANSQREVNTAQQEKDAALDELSEMRRDKNEQEQQASRQQTATAMSLRVEILKTLCATAQQTLDRMVAASINPLLARVNELCGGILPAPIEYHTGELGMQRGEKYVTWHTFGGAEKMLFLCAVQIALAAGSTLKLAILDEVGRLDERNRAKVVDRVFALVKSGTLDQALLIDAEHWPWWERVAFGCKNCSLTNLNDPC